MSQSTTLLQCQTRVMTKNEKKEHKDKSRSARHAEKKLKRKLGKKLIKSVSGGLAKVKKKAELCKANGVSIDYVDRKTSASTLHVASIMGLKDVVEYLIENGAMVDLRDSYGNTPLLYAVTHHRPEVARVLVNCHANLHATNHIGQSPSSLGVVNLLELEARNRKRGINDSAAKNVINVDSSEDEEEDEEEREIKRVRREWEREERERQEREKERDRDRWGVDGEDEFDWQSHLDAEYSDNEESNNYSNWRDIEEDYKEMESDSWMDRIAQQARERFSRTIPQREKEKQQKEETKEREETYRRLLEEEMQKDKEWRERVMKAAAMNNSELDEENWVKFDDLKLENISHKDIPWPSGPADNILGIKENLPKQAKKQLVRAGLLRWHPDKFMQKFGSRLLEKERESILEKVKEVSQSINQFSEKRLS